MAEPVGAKMMRKLSELRVIDLKNELEKRGLDKNGVKQILIETLKTVIHDLFTMTCFQIEILPF